MGADIGSVEAERRIRLGIADLTAFLTDDRCGVEHLAEIDERLGAVMEIVDRAKKAPEETR